MRNIIAHISLFIIAELFILINLASAQIPTDEPNPVNGTFVPQKPFVYDPVKRECGDPTILFNHDNGNAWIFYTQRPHWETDGAPGWYHGSPVGILSSGFGGYSWLYRGIAQGLDNSFEPGLNTYWAPEVIYHKGKYHMYVTFLRGVPIYQGKNPHRYMKDPIDEKAGCILYYTSTNMIGWKFVKKLNLKPDNGGIIDAAIHPLPDGTWRMWYRARETNNKDKWEKTLCAYADSKNLRDWEPKGNAIELGDSYAEGACVFHWKGYYWMLLDGMERIKYGNGYTVFRSKDATEWEHNGCILDWNEKEYGGHGSVVVQNDRAFVLYQTRTGAIPGDVGELAELFVENGKLKDSRNIAPMKLDPAMAPKFRGGLSPNFNE